QFALPTPGAMDLGDIRVSEFPGAGREARWIAWAASVMHFTSNSETIRRIGRELGTYASAHPHVQIIESPLLGTGAGGLDPIDAGMALKSGFEETCRTDATLFIYGQVATIMAKLRLTAIGDNALAEPPRRQEHDPIQVLFSFAHEDE